MTEQEKIKFKSLNILKDGVLTNNKTNKNSYKKNYSISFPVTNLSINLDRSFSNPSLPKLSLTKEIKKDKIFCAIKEIEVQYLATSSQSREKALTSSNIMEPKIKLTNYNLPIKTKRLITKATKV